MNVASALNQWKEIIEENSVEENKSFSDYQLSGITHDLVNININPYNLLPICTNVSVRTIGLDLVSVSPMDNWFETEE